MAVCRYRRPNGATAHAARYVDSNAADTMLPPRVTAATWERPLPHPAPLACHVDDTEQAEAEAVVAEQGAAVEGQAAGVGAVAVTEATEEDTTQVELRFTAGCEGVEVRVMMTVTAAQAKLPTITEHVMLNPQAPSPMVESSADNDAAEMAKGKSSAAVSRAPSHVSVSRTPSSSNILSPCDSLDWSRSRPASAG